jgi:hypothetical protein
MYATIEAEIKNGKILPRELGRLPESGHALLIILDQPNIRNEWKKVRQRLGWLKTDIDPAKWQNRARDEWQDRK